MTIRQSGTSPSFHTHERRVTEGVSLRVIQPWTFSPTSIDILPSPNKVFMVLVAGEVSEKHAQSRVHVIASSLISFHRHKPRFFQFSQVFMVAPRSGTPNGLHFAILSDILHFEGNITVIRPEVTVTPHFIRIPGLEITFVCYWLRM